MASYEPFILMCREKKRVRPNLVGLYNVKIMFYRYLYRILLVELLSETSISIYYYLHLLIYFS